MNYLLVLLLICVNLFGKIRTDTPANCTFDDIQGSWIFSESDRSSTSKEVCNGSEPVVNKIRIDLLFPDQAIDQFGNKVLAVMTCWHCVWEWFRTHILRRNRNPSSESLSSDPHDLHPQSSVESGLNHPYSDPDVWVAVKRNNAIRGLRTPSTVTTRSSLEAPPVDDPSTDARPATARPVNARSGNASKTEAKQKAKQN